ncbi:MAG TPA: AI-2E family transporter [Nocardioidaceae bacterium]|nr:AI-2E family transporter [Nocardioidaceae bacterium]
MSDTSAPDGADNDERAAGSAHPAGAAADPGPGTDAGTGHTAGATVGAEVGGAAPAPASPAARRSPGRGASRRNVTRGRGGLGRPGRALARHSPFNIGFFGAAGVIVALALKELLVAASSVILLVSVAMFLAVGLNPWVEWLQRRGLRRGFAVLAVFAAVLAILVLFGFTIVPVIVEQVQAIVQAAPELIADLQDNRWVRRVDERFDILQRVQEQIASGNIGAQIAGGVLGVGLAVLGALVNVFFVLVLTLYFLGSLHRIKRSMYALVPASRRERTAQLGDAILAQVGGYVSGAFVIALIAGATSLLFFLFVGLADYAVALAFVVLLLDLIPMIGATIAAVIVSVIGLAVDPSIGLACAIFFIIYQQVENYLIYPRVMSSTVDVPGAAVVVAVLAGATLLGVIGALMAIPIAAGVLLLLREVVVRRQDAR